MAPCFIPHRPAKFLLRQMLLHVAVVAVVTHLQLLSRVCAYDGVGGVRRRASTFPRNVRTAIAGVEVRVRRSATESVPTAHAVFPLQ